MERNKQTLITLLFNRKSDLVYINKKGWRQKQAANAFVYCGTHIEAYNEQSRTKELIEIKLYNIVAIEGLDEFQYKIIYKEDEELHLEFTNE